MHQKVRRLAGAGIVALLIGGVAAAPAVDARKPERRGPDRGQRENPRCRVIDVAEARSDVSAARRALQRANRRVNQARRAVSNATSRRRKQQARRQLRSARNGAKRAKQQLDGAKRKLEQQQQLAERFNCD